MRSLVVAIGCAVLCGSAQARQEPERLGLLDGGARVSSSQVVRPAGESLSFDGRPVDVALSPDGKLLFAKDDQGLVVIDAAAWKIVQRLSTGDPGTSVHGLTVSADGKR